MQRFSYTHRIVARARVVIVAFATAIAVMSIGAHTLTAQTSDALLYLSPASAMVTIGETFTVEVLLDTGGQTINAAEGAITFREQDLTVVSLDAAGAIFSSWVEVPSYEANSGRITFSGVTGREGYAGDDGRVVRITFRALRNTSSQVWFSQGAAVLSADGQASNVLSQLRSGTYTLTSREVVPSLAQVSEASTSEVPSAQTISGAAGPIRSSTHPTEVGWYGTSTAFLRWEVSDGVVEIRTGISTDGVALPTDRHEEVLDERIVPTLPEGIAYFTLRMRDANGWGSVYRYRLQTDTVPPRGLALSEIAREDPTDPEVLFTVGAIDDMSGVVSYAVSLNGARPQTLPADESVITQIIETPGAHTLRVTAYDRAGNSTSTTATFAVEALETPRIAHIPEHALVGNTLLVRGDTYPQGDVIVSVRFNDGEAIERRVTADVQGAFTATIVDTAREGEYETMVTAVDARGARSLPSAPQITLVAQPTLVLFGTLAVNYISIFGALFGLVSFLVFLIWATLRMVRSMRRRVHDETTEAIEALHTSFSDIKHDARSLVRVITRASQKRPLTDEEELVVATMQKHLAEAEEHITKEITDIERTTHIVPPKRVRIAKPTPRVG